MRAGGAANLKLGLRAPSGAAHAIVDHWKCCTSIQMLQALPETVLRAATRSAACTANRGLEIKFLAQFTAARLTLEPPQRAEMLLATAQPRRKQHTAAENFLCLATVHMNSSRAGGDAHIRCCELFGPVGHAAKFLFCFSKWAHGFGLGLSSPSHLKKMLDIFSASYFFFWA